ncbi:MAG: hypothetical protein EA379_10340 [Phycisphaerales bacterium]|nr:MAG: hypothetical protein EA379_10340 [Phycisphaerales bacterium]
MSPGVGRAARWWGALAMVFCALFLFAAAAKVSAGLFTSLEPLHRTVVRLTSLSDGGARALGVGLGAWEFALGLALGLRLSPRLVSIATAATLLVFTVAMARLASLEGAEGCGCFGENWLAGAFGWDARQANLAGLARNVVLLALCVPLVALSWRVAPTGGAHDAPGHDHGAADALR